MRCFGRPFLYVGLPPDLGLFSFLVYTFFKSRIFARSHIPAIPYNVLVETQTIMDTIISRARGLVTPCLSSTPDS